jgi:hypothetical protein
MPKIISDHSLSLRYKPAKPKYLGIIPPLPPQTNDNHKKRTRPSTILTPYKKGPGISHSPDNLEIPSPMDFTPGPSHNPSARSIYKAARNGKLVINIEDGNVNTKLGDLCVSPKGS